MTESERAPDVDQPEGGTPPREADGTGTTPHTEEPAEGEELDGGADTPDV
ncbi:hypothetical protein [Candidatus Blastococcus massiliensis]|nr:hypothetical protein [Candidatus Blastococcus massiliensis]